MFLFHAAKVQKASEMNELYRIILIQKSNIYSHTKFIVEIV